MTHRPSTLKPACTGTAMTSEEPPSNDGPPGSVFSLPPAHSVCQPPLFMLVCPHSSQYIRRLAYHPQFESKHIGYLPAVGLALPG